MILPNPAARPANAPGAVPEGPDRLPNFLEKWIPLEEHYFRGVGLPAAGDLVLDTTPQGA